MSEKKNEGCKTVNRRGFLVGIASAGSVAVASALITEPADAVAETESRDDDGGQPGTGYRITAHILEYYEKARF